MFPNLITVHSETLINSDSGDTPPDSGEIWPESDDFFFFLSDLIWASGAGLGGSLCQRYAALGEVFDERERESERETVSERE
jgi:hypothetical protein